ncbi:MAG TPA: hypothetical protein V6C58_19540 [Allocoleopsis sp.]
MKNIVKILSIIAILGVAIYPQATFAQNNSSTEEKTNNSKEKVNEVPATQTAQPGEIFTPKSTDPFNNNSEGSANVLNLINQIQLGGGKSFNTQEQNENISNEAEKVNKLRLQKIREQNQQNNNSIPFNILN